jgi:hypothetical protein
MIPSSETTAIEGSCEDHIIFLFVAFAGVITHERCIVSPVAIIAEFLDNVSFDIVISSESLSWLSPPVVSSSEPQEAAAIIPTMNNDNWNSFNFIYLFVSNNYSKEWREESEGQFLILPLIHSDI